MTTATDIATVATFNRTIFGINNPNLVNEYFQSFDDPGLKYKFTIVDYMEGVPINIQIHHFETCTEAQDYIFANDREFMCFHVLLNTMNGKTLKLTDQDINAFVYHEERGVDGSSPSYTPRVWPEEEEENFEEDIELLY
jgi:hypothetical protein